MKTQSDIGMVDRSRLTNEDFKMMLKVTTLKANNSCTASVKQKQIMIPNKHFVDNSYCTVHSLPYQIAFVSL